MDHAGNPPQFNEIALRRPEFRPGPTVTLADGRAWTFPSPRLVIVPVVVPGQEFELDYESEFGPQFDHKLAAVQKSESFTDEARALLGIAADLLGWNYDLRAAEYRALLRYEPGNDEANRYLGRIYSIALGRPVGPETEEVPESVEDLVPIV